MELEIAAGECCCVIGANDAGKSTFCRVLCGLIPHFYQGEFRGSVRVGVEETSTLPIYKMVSAVGYVMDDPYEQLTRVTETVYAEIAFGLQNIGLPEAEILQRVDEVVIELRIKDLVERAPTRLSNGEQQRVVIAAILAQYPDILVLDEAASQLDPQGAKAVYQIARRFKEKGKTVILVEPRLDPILPIVDKFILLDKGRVVATGTPAEIIRDGHLERLKLGLPSYPWLAKELVARRLVKEYTPIHLEEAQRMVQEAMNGTDSH
jgi:energy-coupling factor transporter ATP-binding protein EcfA2